MPPGGGSKKSRVDNHFCFLAQASNQPGLTIFKAGIEVAASYFAPSAAFAIKWVLTVESKFRVNLVVDSVEASV